MDEGKMSNTTARRGFYSDEDGSWLETPRGDTAFVPWEEWERLREDAARLDWLHDHIISTGSAEFFSANIRDTDEIHMIFDPGAVVETVREAIDARRALEGK